MIISEHWEVRRLKYLLQQEQDTRSADGREQLLCVSKYTGVTQRKRADGGDDPDTGAESLIGYKCAERNDLVVNIMLAWNDSTDYYKPQPLSDLVEIRADLPVLEEREADGLGRNYRIKGTEHPVLSARRCNERNP